MKNAVWKSIGLHMVARRQHCQRQQQQTIVATKVAHDGREKPHGFSSGFLKYKLDRMFRTKTTSKIHPKIRSKIHSARRSKIHSTRRSKIHLTRRSKIHSNGCLPCGVLITSQAENHATPLPGLAPRLARWATTLRISRSAAKIKNQRPRTHNSDPPELAKSRKTVWACKPSLGHLHGALITI